MSETSLNSSSKGSFSSLVVRKTAVANSPSLHSSPPFTVVYEFNSKRHSVPLSSSHFSRIATAPGTFKILSVGHGSDECKSNAVDLVKTVYAIPTARVSEGKDVFVDIREGDQTEIVFSFVGEPPFTFTYSRRQPQDRVKDRTVLETHTVTCVFIFLPFFLSGLRLTWCVTAGGSWSTRTRSLRPRRGRGA